MFHKAAMQLNIRKTTLLLKPQCKTINPLPKKAPKIEFESSTNNSTNRLQLISPNKQTHTHMLLPKIFECENLFVKPPRYFSISLHRRCVRKGFGIVS